MQSQTHANTQQDTPQLTEALLEDLLNPAMTPILICQIHGLTLAQLNTIIHSTDYRNAIEAIQSINAARQPVIESQTHLQSLAALKSAGDLAHQLALQSATLPPSPSLLGEGRGEGSHLSSPTPSKSSQSSLHLRALESLRKSTTTLLRETRPTPRRRPRKPTTSGWRGGVVPDSSMILIPPKKPPTPPQPQLWHAVCDTSPAGIWCSRRNTDAPTEARHELRHSNLSIRSTHLHPPTRRDVRKSRKPWYRRV